MKSKVRISVLRISYSVTLQYIESLFFTKYRVYELCCVEPSCGLLSGFQEYSIITFWSHFSMRTSLTTRMSSMPYNFSRDTT